MRESSAEEGPFSAKRYYKPTFSRDPWAGLQGKPYTAPLTAVHTTATRAAPPPPLSGAALAAALRQQVEFYFSPANLATDAFLRQHMDPEGGWVDLAVVAAFPRVHRMSQDVDMIAAALSGSAALQLERSGGGIGAGSSWRIRGRVKPIMR